MDRLLAPVLVVFAVSLPAQTPAAPTTLQLSQAEATTPATAPLPPTRELILDVERSQKAAEAAQRDYVYHVHTEQQDLNKGGGVKRTTVTDADSLTIGGVRVNRVTARDGKPLTPDEAKKEDERIDKEVAKAKERRAKRDEKGENTDTRGDAVLSAARILELGTFSNPRRVLLNGRPTIALDYAGDPNAKTHNAAESMFRDLVGVVWVDEHDRVLAQAEGHFLNDFKLGGGLLINIHKGFHFRFRAAAVNGEVWLPASIDVEGSARFLLFDNIDGRLHLATSDYRKFRTGSRVVPGVEVVPDETPTPPTAAPH